MTSAGVADNSRNSQRFSRALWQYYRAGRLPIIPDLKFRSPGEGDLLAGRDPLAIAAALAQAGAPALSVVTEPKFFGGSARLLPRIAEVASIPILRKDFINNRKQLRETADLGASAVLLIASMLDQEILLSLVEYSQQLGLEPLVEIHNKAEIDLVSPTRLTMMGINNRDITKLEIDEGSVDTTEGLAGFVPPDVLLISASGIASWADARRAQAAGAHAVLVGTAILKAPDPTVGYQRLSVSREVYNEPG